jgi:site-specific DNA-methyltransferase (adenine-specific)
MKRLNDGKQMRSDWLLQICSGPERIRAEGEKVHSTQKPEALLYRIILASSDPGDVVLDPFFGTGTTGAVAKKLHRDWIGIEREQSYIDVAQKRIDAITPESFNENTFDVSDRKRQATRVPFVRLLERGLVTPGQALYFRKNPEIVAYIKPDGHLRYEVFEGSIHQTGKFLMGGSPCNGWEHWYYQDEQGELHPIDRLREILRQENHDT